MTYKFLSHTADVKFQAGGRTIEEAFKSSALALKETISGKIKIKGGVKKSFSVKGKDIENLLYNFLEEFLYLLDAEEFLFSKIKKIKIEKTKRGFLLTAEVLGDKASKYDFTNDVKAVTYNSMFVKKEKNGEFICQVVLDV